MKQRSLTRVLGAQWALFATALLFGLGVLGLVALYVLEDSFLDARLLAAERTLAGEHSTPAEVELRRLHELPIEQHARLRDLAPGALREFHTGDGRYLHVRALASDDIGPRFLVLDAHNELRVTSALARSTPILITLLLAVLLLAAWLARRFVGRIERSTAGLVDALEEPASPETLRATAERQPVAELGRLGRALADAWEARQQSLVREQRTLRLLAHELRTPLQSIRLSLASLRQDSSRANALARLERGVQRLERASAAVLWLGESPTPPAKPVALAAALNRLSEELAPLAALRGQRIESQVIADAHWSLPIAVVEAILGNLLLNAIQHGGPGTITVRLRGDSVEIENPHARGNGGEPGFGIGLELSRRLLGRIGWSVILDMNADRVCARLSAATVDATNRISSRERPRASSPI